MGIDFKRHEWCAIWHKIGWKNLCFRYTNDKSQCLMPLSKQVEGRIVPSCSLAAEPCGIVTYARFPQQPMSSSFVWHTPPKNSRYLTSVFTGKWLGVRKPHAIVLFEAYPISQHPNYLSSVLALGVTIAHGAWSMTVVAHCLLGWRQDPLTVWSQKLCLLCFNVVCF